MGMVAGFINILALTVLAVVPAVFIVWNIYKSDKVEKEPVSLLVKIAGFGALSVISAIVLELIGDGILEFIFGNGTIFNLISCYFVVALSEEGGKFVATYFTTWKNKEFDYRFDGVVYAVCASAGFAIVENIGYVVLPNDYGTGILRAITAVPAHIVFATFMGHFYGEAKYQFCRGNSQGGKKNLRLALLVPVLIHGTYDFLIFETATLAEHDNSAFVILTLASYGFIIAMDIISVKKLREYSRMDVALFKFYPDFGQPVYGMGMPVQMGQPANGMGMPVQMGQPANGMRMPVQMGQPVNGMGMPVQMGQPANGMGMPGQMGQPANGMGMPVQMGQPANGMGMPRQNGQVQGVSYGVGMTQSVDQSRHIQGQSYGVAQNSPVRKEIYGAGIPQTVNQSQPMQNQVYGMAQNSQVRRANYGVGIGQPTIQSQPMQNQAYGMAQNSQVRRANYGVGIGQPTIQSQPMQNQAYRMAQNSQVRRANHGVGTAQSAVQVQQMQVQQNQQLRSPEVARGTTAQEIEEHCNRELDRNKEDNHNT